MAAPATFGFIGIGNMGWGMARNVAQKMPPSSTLVVYDVDTARLNEFISAAGAHVQIAESPRQVSEQSRKDIIITSLPTASVVRAVFGDPSTGILSATNTTRGKLFLECSTISVSASLEVAKLVKESQLGDFLDTPVSGGPQSANAGSLTFMVGGDADLFTTALPVLKFMGSEENIFICGSLGAGLATKQLNNYAANVSFIGLCEAMNTGVKYGLDPKILAGVINASSGMSWNSLHHNPVKGVNPRSSASHDFKGGFKTELAKGVIDMAVQLAGEVGAELVMGEPLQRVFEEAVKNDKCKEQECRSVYRLFADDDGRDLKH